VGEQKYVVSPGTGVP